MDKKQNTISTTHYVSLLAILLAFVILFQVFGSYIKIGATNFSFVLVPIVLGGVLLDAKAGLFLGFAFSTVVAVMGFAGADAFTNILLIDAPIGTLITIYLKGCLAGFIPALVYKALAGKNQTLALITSALLAPVINTGVFIICMLFLSDVLKAHFVADGTTVIYFLVIICAGINFLVELAINVVLAPALKRVVSAVKRVNR